MTSTDLTPEQVELIVRTVPGGATNVQAIHPLSALQEGMLFHSLLNEGNDTYILSTAFELQSEADVDALSNALQRVVDRHDALRSAVHWEHLPRPVQVVYRRATVAVEQLILDDATPIDEQLTEQLKPYHARIELRCAPPIRLQATSRACRGKFYAILRVHHLVCDHGSLHLVVDELMALLTERANQLGAVGSYREYVTNGLSELQIEAARTFFRKQLGDVREPTAPFAALNVHGDGTRIQEATGPVDRLLARRVRSTARNLGVSVARMFHAAWAIVVAGTSGCDDVVFGTVVLAAHRRRSHGQSTVGMSVNTLPLRLRLHAVSAIELVAQASSELSNLLRHEQTPLTLIQQCTGMSGTAPLFTSILNYRYNARADGSALAGGIRVLGRGEAFTNYPLTLIVDDLGEDLSLIAQTDRAIDPQRLIGYVKTALASLVEALECAPHTPALTISILPARERQQVVDLFNTTGVPFQSDRLIHELFEAEAERRPEAPALSCAGGTLTYAELNGKANQLARFLRDRGLELEDRVGICMERGLDAVIALLGTLKAGAAYLPLDPGQPPERLNYILRDAAPRLVLTQERLKTLLSTQDSTVIALDTQWHEIEPHGSANVTRDSLTPINLAYVIYTSGSTGEPKGVAAEHRGTVNRILAHQDIAPFSEDDVCCQKTSIAFVDAIFEILGPLSYGRPLVLTSEEEAKDVRQLAATIHRARITRLISVPSLAKALVDGVPDAARLLRSLRGWTLSGEELKPDLLRKLRSRLPGCVFVNLYGSSEVAADVTCHVATGAADDDTIGRPITNVRVYILDSRLQPVPIGVAGELYIGGVCVARGYLNRRELTAERFVDDPFTPDRHARLYKSGDLGRWRADGAIEYLGRRDFQVKLRGFRVETSEIEARLLEHVDVAQAVVVAREEAPGGKRLVAYVIARQPGAPPGPHALRAHLARRLPDYMVPSAFVVLAAMPVTASGKLHRAALPEPTVAAYARSEYEAPQGEIEELLARIWSALLPIDNVGRDDDFFALGGHSLLAMQVVARIQSELCVDISIRSLFESTTLKQLAARVTDLRDAGLIDRVARGGAEVDGLLEVLTSMPDHRVQELLREARTEGRS